MQKIEGIIKRIAYEMFSSGEIGLVLGWKEGDLPYEAAPTFFHTADNVGSIVYNGFCGSNLSKYLIDTSRNDSKTLVFLKPCDTYGLNQLLSENHVNRKKIYAVGLGCDGKLDITKLRAKGIKGILDIEEDRESLKIKTIYGDMSCLRQDILFEKCLSCKGKEHMIYDELIGADLSEETAEGDRFDGILGIEVMTPDERFDFWRNELSKCIRCNACRNVCTACACNKCIFDNPQSGVKVKVNANDFEENMFHIIRAYHVAGRCVDCGECSRVCPQGIPLHLLNRKFIKDINTFYGEFQAGESLEAFPPLLDYDFNDDEPSVISKGRGKN
jgi:ferredoxin